MQKVKDENAKKEFKKKIKTHEKGGKENDVKKRKKMTKREERESIMIFKKRGNEKEKK